MKNMETRLYNPRFIGYNKCVGNMHPARNFYYNGRNPKLEWRLNR